MCAPVVNSCLSEEEINKECSICDYGYEFDLEGNKCEVKGEYVCYKSVEFAS